VQLLHHLDVDGLQGVASGLDEVDNGVDAVVHDVHAVDLVLGVEVGVEPLLDVLDNGVPRLIVVDEVAKAGCVNNGQSQTNAVLFDVGADGLYRDGLGDVETWGLALLGWVQRGVEERVYQGRLSESRLACDDTLAVIDDSCVSTHTDNHDVEVESLAHTLAMPLVGQVCETHVAGELSAHNVHVVRHGSCGLGVLRCDGVGGLGVAVRTRERLVHGEAAGRGRGRWGRTRWRLGRCTVGFCSRLLARGSEQGKYGRRVRRQHPAMELHETAARSCHCCVCA
jgi:hypothetical protein